MKVKKVREMKQDEIASKLKELRMEYSKLKLSRSKGELKNPTKLTETRHTIARILTVMREKGWK
jgi:large subunit ribosomal protein L29